MNPHRVIDSIAVTLKHLAHAMPLAAAMWLGAGSVQAIPTDSLIHYDFNSVSGNTVTNTGSLGSAANGTLQNASLVAGQIGNGLNFTGSNSGVRTNSNIAIGNAFTLACWVSATNANGGYHRIITNNYTNSSYLGTGGSGAGQYLTITQSAFVDTPNTVDTTGAWHHLAMSWDGTSTRFYYDGVLVTTTAQSRSTTFNSQFGFGCNSDNYSESWNGKMDDAFVFGRALSDAEVTSLYNNAPNSIPAVPSSVTATPASSGTVSVSWAADTNAAGHSVSVTNTVTSVEQVFPTSAATTYSVTGLTNGTPYNFKVLATNALGSSAYSSVINVTPALGTGKNILTFLVPGKPDGVITGTNINVLVPSGTDVTALAPTYTVSAFATGDTTFPSGTARDFTTPKSYTITAEDSTTQTYIVTVTVAPFESTLVWNVATGGSWDLSAINWKGQSSGLSLPFENGKNVIFDNAAGGTITIASGILPATTTVSAASGNYAFTGELGGTGMLVKSGGGSLSVRGITPANTFSGGTLVNAGTLGLGYFDGTTTFECSNPLGSGPVTLSSGAAIILDRTTASNALTVNGGSIANYNGWNSTWTGPITLNATLSADVPNLISLTGTISGIGGITKTSGGPFELSGVNTYSGNTTVSGGTLKLLDNGGLKFVLSNTASNKVTGAGSATFDGDFTIDTSAVSVSSGTWTLVDTSTKVFSSTFTVVGYTPNVDGVTWVLNAGTKTWTFVETTGVLTLVTAATDYENWLVGYPSITAPADKLPAADPDGDGLTNLQEYAFGLSPASGSSVNPISEPLDKTNGTFNYTRRATPATTGLTYSVQTSTDLTTWTTDAAASQSVLGAIGDVQTVQVTLSAALPLTAPTIFVRVKAVQ
jgi:autotransporter-associated beta strand protein